MIICHTKGGKQNMGQKYYPGDKFVIKIDDVLDSTSDGSSLYRIKGFNSLVFDETGLEKLDKYKNHQDAYTQGVRYAEEVYKKFFELNSVEIREIFGAEGGSVKRILSKCNVEEIDKRILDYCPDFEVGDEVVSKTDISSRWLVTFIQEFGDPSKGTLYHLMHSSGMSESMSKSLLNDLFRKTGRKFTSVDSFRTNEVEQK